ncbi:hypothetical protein ATE84_5316 [Aquimarina sp. MAR_2010_214]|uniref:hypothetical protein n=1 Tax=Aquimarina sp. MAR_2010_214 TaxID=1250026 RepID=UPI000C703A3B|nr:hypothetical protein [Aquimarina sp. MAR_2010_214]PKV48023.1 hypothetical protein ATE84_0006 [Aquimarina sp. MAR_2010_214]PKV53180.1 hypothetical protein ATE84_5316 [Aquimarina sp. MAR_2010_214]
MENEKIDKIIIDFLEEFNHMCTTTRKDFLIRERIVTYEHSSSVKRYNITHQIRRKKNEWLIEGVSTVFWIFKKRFPLLRINRINDKIRFTGVFTSSFLDFDITLIESQLKEYLEICKKQPEDVFAKS